MEAPDTTNWTNEDVDTASRLMSMPGALSDTEYGVMKEAVGQYVHGQEVEKFNGAVNTEPKRAPEVRVSRPTKGSGGGVQNRSDAMYAGVAGRGIDVDSGAPTEWRQQYSTLRGNAGARDYVQYVVDKDIRDAGHTIPANTPTVWVDEESDKLTYLRAEKDGSLVPTLFNEQGMSGDDLAAEWRNGADIALEAGADAAATLAGAAAGFVVFGPIGAAVGGIAAGSLASGTSNYALNQYRKGVVTSLLADEYGDDDPEVNKLVQTIHDDDQMGEALVSAALSAVVPTATGAVKTVRNYGKLNAYATAKGNTSRFQIGEIKKKVKKIKADAQEENLKTLKVMREFNDAAKKNGTKEVQPTAGQVSNDVTVQIYEATAKRNAYGPFGSVLEKQQLDNKLAIGDAVRTLGQRGPIESRAHAEVMNGAENTTDTVRSIIGSANATAEKNVAKNLGDIDLRINRADKIHNEEYWKQSQKELFDAKADMKKVEVEDWRILNEMTGLMPDKKLSRMAIDNSAPSTPIKSLLRDLDAETGKRLLQATRDSEARALKKIGVEMPKDKGPSLLDDSLDFNQAQYMLSGAKAELRHAKEARANGNTPDWEPRVLNKIIKAMEGQIRDGKNYVMKYDAAGAPIPKGARDWKVNPEHAEKVSLAWGRAHETSFRYFETMENGVMNKITELNKQGEFVLDSGLFRELVFKKNNTQPAKQALEAGSHNPQMKANMGRELMTMWRGMVEPNGTVSLKGMEDFKNFYGNHADMILSNGRKGTIQNAYDMQRKVKGLQKAADDIKAITEQMFGKKLTTGNFHGDIVKMSLSGDSGLKPSQIQHLKRTLKAKDPALYRSVMRQGREQLERDLLKQGGEFAKFGAIEKLAGDAARLQKLGAWYGDAYAQDLKRLGRMAEYLKRGTSAQGSRVEHQNMFIQGGRSLLGPMDPMQRKITAVTRLTKNMGTRRMAKIISNPKMLDSMFKISSFPDDKAKFAFLQRLVVEIGREAITDEEQFFMQTYAESIGNTF